MKLCHWNDLPDGESRGFDPAGRGQDTVLIGTGGFARLFEDEKLFDAHVPELVLIGLREALALNS